MNLVSPWEPRPYVIDSTSAVSATMSRASSEAKCSMTDATQSTCTATLVFVQRVIYSYSVFSRYVWSYLQINTLLLLQRIGTQDAFKKNIHTYTRTHNLKKEYNRSTPFPTVDVVWVAFIVVYSAFEDTLWHGGKYYRRGVKKIRTWLSPGNQSYQKLKKTFNNYVKLGKYDSAVC